MEADHDFVNNFDPSSDHIDKLLFEQIVNEHQPLAMSIQSPKKGLTSAKSISSSPLLTP